MDVAQVCSLSSVAGTAFLTFNLVFMSEALLLSLLPIEKLSTLSSAVEATREALHPSSMLEMSSHTILHQHLLHLINTRSISTTAAIIQQTQSLYSKRNTSHSQLIPHFGTMQIHFLKVVTPVLAFFPCQVGYIKIVSEDSDIFGTTTAYELFDVPTTISFPSRFNGVHCLVDTRGTSIFAAPAIKFESLPPIDATYCHWCQDRFFCAAGKTVFGAMMMYEGR
ncbi:hypothetical protein BU16DRAFT_560180 [Lophium mytilinum]|uniref:Uncharacterized protein n=1 Tax=Lophium mytilinum TaxID=390894 RepID=A0A6A6QWP0_9PEZI|nr:hypothetical protein BU16DRAFT_560180 [Lophium mytilinum]